MNLCRALVMVAIFLVFFDVVAAAPFDGYVEPEHWAERAVKRSIDEGILTGYGNGKFNGKRLITRFQAAVWYARLSDHFQSKAGARNTLNIGQAITFTKDIQTRMKGQMSKLECLSKRIDRIAELLKVDISNLKTDRQENRVIDGD